MLSHSGVWPLLGCSSFNELTSFRASFCHSALWFFAHKLAKSPRHTLLQFLSAFGRCEGFPTSQDRRCYFVIRFRGMGVLNGLLEVFVFVWLRGYEPAINVFFVWVVCHNIFLSRFMFLVVSRIFKLAVTVTDAELKLQVLFFNQPPILKPQSS